MLYMALLVGWGWVYKYLNTTYIKKFTSYDIVEVKAEILLPQLVFHLLGDV